MGKVLADAAKMLGSMMRAAVTCNAASGGGNSTTSFDGLCFKPHAKTLRNNNGALKGNTIPGERADVPVDAQAALEY